MPYMTWRPELEVGHGTMDAEHRTLVEALNRFHDAMAEGRGQAEVDRTLVFLRDYAVGHFTTEEELMVRHGYPEAAAHFADHADLISRVSSFLAEHRAGRVRSAEEMLAFLEDWLLEHILVQDRELGAFLARRGASR